MRLSEKTIELNFCAQLTASYTGACFWFGLTQRQEAKAGFDAAVRLAGRLYIFQFKASSHDVAGARRFHARHQQLVNLRNRCTGDRSVFYVLPEVGKTSELRGSTNLLDKTWLLDVNELYDVKPPVTPWNTGRKNETHYFDIKPPLISIHSPIVEKEMTRADQLLILGLGEGAAAKGLAEMGFEDFWHRPTRFTGTTVAFVTIPERS